MSDSTTASLTRRWRRRWATAAVVVSCLTMAAVQSGASATAAACPPPGGGLDTVTTIASTVPANGDVNPYGVAVVPASMGALHRGDVLVSNFNAQSNLQGTGTTIVQVDPRSHHVTTFATISPEHLPGACPGGVGLTTALVALRSGWVVVGSLPTADGTAATAKAGCLLVLDDHGAVRETISGAEVNGPWDMTALDFGDFAQLFVTNVLNGTVAANGATVQRGTVVRISLNIAGHGSPRVLERTVIGSGFGEHTDPAALVVGPTGVGLTRDGTLFVADSVANRVTAIPGAPSRVHSAGTGMTVTSGGALNTPLGLIVNGNGQVLTVNAGDGNLVVTEPGTGQVAIRTLDRSGTPPGAGALFGLAEEPGTGDVFFVNDATNTLNRLS